MTERKPSFAPDVDWGPVNYMLPVTPSDVDDLPEDRHGFGPRCIYVGSQGNLAMRFGDNTTVIVYGLQPGVPHPIRPTRIMATDTTASNIVAGY